MVRDSLPNTEKLSLLRTFIIIILLFLPIYYMNFLNTNSTEEKKNN